MEKQEEQQSAKTVKTAPSAVPKAAQSAAQQTGVPGLADVLESISDAFFALDHDWRFTYLNGAAERLLARRRQELLGRVIWQEFPQSLGTEFEKQYHRAVAEQTTVEFEEFYPPLESWFAVRAYPTPSGISVYFQEANDRRRTQQAMRDSQERVREAAERLNFVLTAAELGDWDWDAASDLIRLSPRAAEILGIPADRVRKRSDLREFLDPIDHERARAAVESPVQEGRYKIEYRVNRTDGRQIWVFANGRARYDAQGRMKGMAGIVQDITHQKRADAAQRELAEKSNDAKFTAEASLARWQAIIANMAEGVVVGDPKGNLLDMNRAALEMHGYRDVSEIRHHLTQIAPVFEIRTLEGAVIPFEQWPIPRLLRGEAFSNMEVRLSRADKGFELIVSYSGTPIRDHEGRITLVLLTLHDMTVERRAQQSLRESESRFREMFEQTPIGMTLNDLGGRYLHANPAYCRTVGYTREELLSPTMDFRDLIHPNDRPKMLGRQAELLSGQIPAFFLEKRYVRRDGSLVWVRVTGTVRRDADGKAIQFVRLVEDINDRKRAEAELAQLLDSERAARSEAERASRMKDEFLATLSHELRTPLNAILGWSQILAGGEKNEADLAEGLRTIERNARAQTQIIEDLLDMSRIISGKIRLDVQRLDLAALVQAAVDSLRPAADAKGVRLLVVLDPRAGVINGDPARLQQVLWNLLSNAVKFTPRGGRVQVVLEHVNSRLEVSIADTGEGISADFLPQVFDRFRQSDASTTRRHGGLGLGLAIVKQLVELHGGMVRAKSPGAGAGSTFTISLPVMPIQAQPQHSSVPRHPDVPSLPGISDARVGIAGLRVLVVDDEPDARALIRRLLEDCHAAVTVASTAAEALHLVKSERPDVLVSDIGMPHEDGYTLIRRIRALKPEEGGETPAVALTAYARAEDRMRATMAGYQHHVAKPVEPAELITMVSSLSKKRR